MPTPVFNSPYADSVAERGKFVALDMSDTASYPVTGMGKFAVLVYPIAGGSAAVPTYTVQSVSALPDKIVSYQTTLAAWGSAAITVSYPVTFLEVYNKGSATAYVLLSTSTALQASSIGIPVGANTLYKLEDVLVSTMTVFADGISDLRIIGHYK